MANVQNINLNGTKLSIAGTEPIYAELGVSLERFATLLSRDAYTPTLDEAPTSATTTYTDTDGSTNTFAIGQCCRVWDADEEDYIFYRLYDMADGVATWREADGGGTKLPTDVILSSPVSFGVTANTYLDNGILNS